MLADYLMLGLDSTATNEEIRGRYIDLIKTHPPEHDSERFQDITKAYERLKDKRSRIRHQLFGYRKAGDVEESLSYLVRAAQPKRKRAGLNDLLKAVKK